MTTSTFFDGVSPTFPVEGEPAIAGVTTSTAGPICNGNGVQLWTSALACWATAVACDPVTSACAP
jgi:hypothetical protein